MVNGSHGIRVLHVLYSAHPDVTGASIRSRYIVETQAAFGLEPVVISSPFQPPVDATLARGVEELNGVRYFRCFDDRYDHRFMVARKSLAARAKKLTALPAFVREVRRIARRERVDVIHGHSLFFCGLAAALAGRSLGLPSIYEVRSLIEEGLVEEGGASSRGLLHSAYRSLDALSVRLATHVITISEGLRRDLTDRGVAGDRITVIGNGADVAAHGPAAARTPAMLETLGFPPNAFVVGYIGTLFAYESLDLVLDAVAALLPSIPELRLLVVGDGPAREALIARAAAAGITDYVRFTGRVPHEAVANHYATIDLFVLPRRPNRLTDLVTPLKPLEIMARGKPLLASSCGGHGELIVAGENGFLYDAAAPNGLVDAIVSLHGRREDLAAIGPRARRWVSEHRSWSDVIQPTVPLYQRLVAQSARAN
jgi:PEP-CTERM/exosortase A-associated glycosyltransferase